MAIFLSTRPVIMDYLLEVNHLHKQFGQLKAVNDVSFGIRQADFFGPNDAG